MEWIKSVMIVHENTLGPEDRGLHNGKYQAVELRLRSDGKCFFLGMSSKVTLEGWATYSYREERWSKFLTQESDQISFTEEEFLADAERHRKEVDGVYLWSKV
jgi:hypothetical protein